MRYVRQFLRRLKLSDPVETFYNAWANLPEDVRDEIAEKIANVQSLPPHLRRSVVIERYSEFGKVIKGPSMNFGPVPGECPFCGK